MCKGNGRSVAKGNEPLPGHQDGWAEVLHRRASSAFYWSWVCPTLPQRIKPHVMLSFHTQHTPNILLINTELCANGFCHQFSDWYISSGSCRQVGARKLYSSQMKPEEGNQCHVCPKKMKIVKRISTALSSFWIYKGLVRIFTTWRQVRMRWQRKAFSEGVETPLPNILTMENTGKSSFQHIRISKLGQSGIRTWSHLLITSPLALGCGGSGAHSFLVTTSVGLRSNGKSSQVKLLQFHLMR